jgi:uncharacterized glyoxalase superfamily protein PhnB
MTRFECLIPIFRVKSVAASMDYYVNKLGFEKKWDWPEERPHKDFGCVGRDRIEIFFCQDGQGQPGTWVSIFVEDVDALHEEYLKSGAIIRQKPTNFPWGLREMNVEDIDGHRIRMGSKATGPADGVRLGED